MAPHLEFKMISDPRAPEVSQVLDIFVSSFPSNERPPVEKVLKRIELGLYWVIVAKVGNEVVAFSLLFPLTGSEYVLLDYTAVKNGLRGQGIGSKIMKCVLVSEAVRGKQLVLEVEDPDFGEDPRLKKDRIRFYRRFGVRELKDVKYQLPPFDGTQPTEMRILGIFDPKTKVLPREEVQSLIILIYEEVYHRGPDDELLLSFIDDIPDPVMLA